ncbi:MAG: hypothetical protein WC763_06150 [Candidatus Paceibacterota bacterium]|jgi:hypothetical protein
MAKPPYEGTFKGQRWSRPGTQKSRPVSWKDRITGEQKFGRILGKPAPVDEHVWNGSEWVPVPQATKKKKVDA